MQQKKSSSIGNGGGAGLKKKQQKIKNYKQTFQFLKGQLISKELYKVLICTKNERKYFCISVGQFKKVQ